MHRAIDGKSESGTFFCDIVCIIIICDIGYRTMTSLLHRAVQCNNRQSKHAQDRRTINKHSSCVINYSQVGFTDGQLIQVRIAIRTNVPRNARHGAAGRRIVHRVRKKTNQ